MELRELIRIHAESQSIILDRLLEKIKENGEFAGVKTDSITKEMLQNSNMLLTFNLLAMNTEICELANSTRCFKYWSQQSPENRGRMLEELIDIYLMLFSTTSLLGFDAKEVEMECLEKLAINIQRQSEGY